MTPKHVFLLGLLGMLAGLALNPWVAALLFTNDGRIDDVLAVAGVLAVNLLCFWTGFRLVRHRTLSALLLPVRLSVTAAVSVLLLELGFRFFMFGFDSFSIKKMSTLHVLGESGLVRASSDLDVLYELKPNLNTVFKLASLKTNPQGLHDREYATVKPPGTFRAVVVGDSFTMPSGVEIEDAFHTVVEDRLNAESNGTVYEVINFGVAGYDPSQYLAMLKHRALDYDPDLVLFCLSGPIDAFHPRDRFQRAYVVKPTRNTLFTSFTLKYIRRNMVPRWFPGDVEAARRLQEERKIETLERMETMFAELRTISNRHGIPVCVVILQHANLHPEVSTTVMEMAAEYDLHAVDMAPAFENQGMSSEFIIYLIDNHPNARANRVFGDRIYEHLQAQKLTNPSG